MSSMERYGRELNYEGPSDWCRIANREAIALGLDSRYEVVRVEVTPV